MSFTVNNAVKYIHEHLKIYICEQLIMKGNAVEMVHFSASDSLDLYLSLSQRTLVTLEMAVSPYEHCSNFSVIHLKQRAMSSGLTCTACEFRWAFHILPCTSLCTKCPPHRLQGIC